MSGNYRLTIEIDEELYMALRKQIPHGLKRAVFEELAIQVSEGIKKEGITFCASIIDQRIKLLKVEG